MKDKEIKEMNKIIILNESNSQRKNQKRKLIKFSFIHSFDFININKNKQKTIKFNFFKINKIAFIFFLIIKLFFAVSIFFNKFTIKYYNDYLNLYIISHKDFNNSLNNSYYKIVCDERTQLNNKYQIKIIETNKNNELYKKKRGYSEGSKIYYIWKNYKEKKISSKYVGFFHYNRVFDFKNNIPNLDKIFNQYEAIINYRIPLGESMKAQYSGCHIGNLMEEIEEIIKENFTKYYQAAIKSLNSHYISCCNIFIMKKKDFIKYGEFVFGILLEFDRRHQLRNDDDIKNFIESEGKRLGNVSCIPCQFRQEGYLMERISNIFYDYNFKNVLEMKMTTMINKLN